MMRVGLRHVRRADDELHVLLPGARGDARAALALPAARGAARRARIRRCTAVEFECGCGDEHPGLVSHDELDWAPLGLEDETPFLNLMTSRMEDDRDRARRARGDADQGGGVAVELLLLAGGAAAAGVPVGVPAARAGAASDRVGVAVRCPVCGKVSVNLVSRAHVDVPFVNDREVGVVGHLFARRRRSRRSRSSGPSSGRRLRRASPRTRIGRLSLPPGICVRRGRRRW